jgi:type II secretory pathway pseudopilin PulG
MTLVELIIVITIILLVSVVALPTVMPALRHREVSESARIVQVALVGARDAAIRTGRPSGIRLLPDPALNGIDPSTGLLDPGFILECNRVVPIAPAPEYSEGLVSAYPDGTYPNNNIIHSPTGATLYTPTLVLEEQVGQWVESGGAYAFVPNPPTNWMWNVRIGDRVQIEGAGPWYTVVGPAWTTPAAGNAELFVNVGKPGANSPLIRKYTSPDGRHATNQRVEYLLLTDGIDDNANGWVDEGWDGMDNDGDGLVDETTCSLNPRLGEWVEAEAWAGAMASRSPQGAPYVIRRRPVPAPNAREVALPSGVVVDLTGWGLAMPERSRIPASMLNRYTGYADILVNPDGSILPTTLYSCPSSSDMSSAFIHLWLAERSDLASPSTTRAASPYLPVPRGLAPGLFDGQELEGETALVTIFARTGRVAVDRNMPFLLNPKDGVFSNDPGGVANPLADYSPNYPFVPAQGGSY